MKAVITVHAVKSNSVAEMAGTADIMDFKGLQQAEYAGR